MACLEIVGLTVTRDGVDLLNDLHLRIADGERFVVLGPSGSGKTALLRSIAGLEAVTSGRLRLQGQDVTTVAPRDRGIAMVDQEARLQPHLDVRSNLSLPLRFRSYPDDEVDRRVEAQARAFSLRRLFGRRQNTLAAGERHEVALARSLIRRCRLLLLDEPLAKADPPRRRALLRELVEVQEGYGITMLVATNDQQVALTLADRAAVLDRGRLVQLGTPTELFATPATTFVAGFVGTPPMNLRTGRVVRGHRGTRLLADPFRLPTYDPSLADLAGHPCTVGVRPTDLRRATDADRFTIEEIVLQTAVLGDQVEVRLGEPRDPVVATVDRPAPPRGALLRLAYDPAAVHVFDAEGRAVTHGV